MIDYMNEAKAIFDEVRANRRYLHHHAEGGFDLENTVRFIDEKLTELGIEHRKCGRRGIVATVGKGDKCVLLRADMDALPMKEVADVEFKSCTDFTHSCGHDCHATSLLGAAKILKEHESELNGVVKFMFQPAEELLQGALDMIADGVLENPKVDAAFGTHVSVGAPGSTVGTMRYSSGSALYSGDMLTVEVIGKQAHGASSFMGVDAINIAAHIVVALEEIIAREIPMNDNAVVLVGKIEGGDSCNTTAGYAKLEISCRAQTEDKRQFLIQRVKEISEGVAATYRGSIKFTHNYGISPLVCDPYIASIGAQAAEDLGMKVTCIPTSGGTEDFTAVARKVPAVMMNVGAGSLEEGHSCGHHNPGFVVNEDVLPYEVALYCKCAVDYLSK